MDELTLGCGRCGAPLSYDGQAISVTCSFCGAVTLVEGQVKAHASLTTSVATGTGAAAAAVGKVQALLAVSAVGIVVVGIATYTFLSHVAAPAGKALANKASSGRTAVQVVQNPLTTTIDKMALLYPDAKRDVNPMSSSLRIDLDDPTFEYITYEWDAGAPDHVSDLSLNSAQPPTARTAWVTRLGSMLGRQGVAKDPATYDYSWCGVHASVDESRVRVFATNLRVMNIGLGAVKMDWQGRLEQLWDVVKGAVLNPTPSNVALAIRERLGELPFRSLARLDPQTDVDNSRRAVGAILPNSCPTTGPNVSYKTAVDHPWFSDVTLAWENERGAKLNSVTFRPPDTSNGKLANQTAVAKCVVAWLGAPVENEVNHMERIWSYHWARRGQVSVHIYDSYVWADGPFSTGEWRRLIQVLDDCGRR